nr:immunoglobulin heavy chain junction region [Macaca mulatta]MOX91860.1 immunoglobulin heavy chain junction region [Macaca mulatta]MOX91921.1 immunoglobulin heavy chain junction region [Macaca mulatta]MOX91934.1 immunoglobulin heavy chain junction region [Macaca mulatta]MOX92104.1 immunoglobulin heavy chain junction region [Macaca mulatta]
CARHVPGTTDFDYW